jgi:protoheme IX farnesyltransferase
MSVATSQPEVRSAAATLRDYLSLLKLRIVALLDATALGVMLPASHGHLRLQTVAAVVVGMTFAAGGANAINCWFDRDIDAQMTRTRRRPLPAGRIPPSHALALGIGLNVLAFAVLWAYANLLAAVLALTGALIYVFVYTIWLKRSTPQNIVIGGAAGAVPPLVGWAAASGSLDLTALAFFGVVLFWTPPHFWALAQLIRADYARAGIPMLPVVAGDQTAKRQSIVYAVLAAGVSLVPFFTHAAGVVYLAGAIVLGIGLVGISLLDLHTGAPTNSRRSLGVRGDKGRRWTRRMFAYSLVYLALLFTLFAASPYLP